MSAVLAMTNFNENEFREKVGIRIKMRRIELGIVQADLGKLLNVSQERVSGWELGRRAFRIEQAAAVAKALKTSVAYLVGERK